MNINNPVDMPRDEIRDDAPPATESTDSRPLSELRVGSAGEVTRLGLPRATATRLMELGVLPGTRLEVVRVAPLGDPMEIRLRGYSLSLRRAEAAGVSVALDATSPTAGARP